MLLAGLQGHAQRGVAAGVLGHADDAARHGALEFVAGGEERRVRAAVAHRHAEALGAAEHHVGAEFARRGEQQQAEQVGGDAGDGLLGMQVGDQAAQVADFAAGVRVLQQRAEHVVAAEVFHFVDRHFEAEGIGAGLHHGDGLRVAVGIDEEHIALGLRHALGQGHGFGGGGGFVEQRGAGQVEAGEVDGQLLEVQQRLQAALGDLRLVRGVGGVPARVFQHVAQDHRGRDGAVVAGADQAGPHLVLLCVALQLGQRGLLVEGGGQIQRTVQQDRRRHGLDYQLIEAGDAEGFQHRLLFGLVGAEMAAEEGVGLVQLGKRRAFRHGVGLELCSLPGWPDGVPE
ncbi:hypothetical protein D3C81_857860 [compost metagenome]